MLSKEIPANQAVNIIRPVCQLNYSSCTDSSFSTTASSIPTSPMIRQPSVESNPGLSFFCPALKQQHATFEKVQSQPPLVISRINLTHRKLLDEEDDIDIDIDTDDTITSDIKVPQFNKTGFGIMTGGLASFMLRGNITTTPPPVQDDARANRKVLYILSPQGMIESETKLTPKNIDSRPRN